MIEKNSFLILITEKIELKKFKKIIKEDFKVKNSKDFAFQDLNFEFKKNENLKLNENFLKIILHDEDSKNSNLTYFDKNENKKNLNFPIKKEDFLEILKYKNIPINFHLNKSINRDEIEEILEKINFLKTNGIFVKRSEFENKNLKIKIDDVENLGIYIKFIPKINSINEIFILKNFIFEFEKITSKDYFEEMNKISSK